MENGKLFLLSVMVFVCALFDVSAAQAAGVNDSSTESIRVRITKLKNESVSFTGLGLRFPGQPQAHPGLEETARVLRVRQRFLPSWFFVASPVAFPEQFVLDF